MIKGILGNAVIILLVAIISVSTLGCLTNLADCPEDTFKTESCPSDKDKEEHSLMVILLVLMNNGHVPPGQLLKNPGP